MQENNDKNQGKNGLSFESLDILIAKWKDGTFSEIIDDWKWIFSYSVRYKWAIVFYTILGIFSTSMGLVSSVAGKYLIDIITGYKTNKLMILIIVMLGSSLFSLLFSSIISRISAKLSIYINNDIQADIFDKIVDADWLEINKYSNGDVLNRFNGDIGTVSSNAISWLPTIVIAIYNFIATFLVILHYNAVMAILALASAPFMLLMSRFMIKKQREYSQKTREMSSKLMTFEVEAFYNFDTIKSFGIAPHYSRLMRWWQGKFKDVSLEYNMFSIKTNILLSVMGTGVEFIAFGYCLFLLWTHGIYRKIMEKKDPSALLPLINYAVNHVRTNMSVSEMYSMAKDVLSVDDLKMQQTCIPQDGTYTDITYEGMQVLKVDFDANKKKIEQLLY